MLLGFEKKLGRGNPISKESGSWRSRVIQLQTSIWIWRGFGWVRWISIWDSDFGLEKTCPRLEHLQQFPKELTTQKKSLGSF
jgi:hypothetical protein